MPMRKNPLRLNKLQLRTLALTQLMAKDKELSETNPGDDEVTVSTVPSPAGGTVQIGSIAFSARDASGLSNPSVWKALERKGIIRFDSSLRIVVTATGLNYDTGLGDKLNSPTRSCGCCESEEDTCSA